ncbi:transglycosylase SLT domain-containing protein [Budviciaceae bacterium BWR-B9]|uniref:Transglycosylase SLT domain-containing protein n=1 Tax=Limnobaculum allomyrinae TaxID=2791986 RepID=A0ABS1IUY2_9GAMM|nr:MULTISPECIES: transglycosylase SLT domain-containing protein [Limnobaculum]MBK5145560.1 transglycosylase SLT domain-containing protein [Limnobaculum allomyrinae]MBV7693678.1 transglycosylase SLT domain-containing protein [Limnobaculum sp. M2-1]
MIRLFLLSLFLISFFSNASDCYDRAGRDYQIDPDLLRAISFRESSFRQNVMNIQSRESYAIGYMQIHSQNLQHLSKFGITADQLYSDGCMNIYTGAYFLALSFKRLGKGWDAVGAYNAGFAKNTKQQQRRTKYAKEVYGIYKSIKSNKSASN